MAELDGVGVTFLDFDVFFILPLIQLPHHFFMARERLLSTAEGKCWRPVCIQTGLMQRHVFPQGNTWIVTRFTHFLSRVPVCSEGPGEGHGDPSAAAGRFSGRLHQPHPEELHPNRRERRGAALGNVQSGPQSDSAGQHGRLRPQPSALEHHQETE